MGREYHPYHFDSRRRSGRPDLARIQRIDPSLAKPLGGGLGGLAPRGGLFGSPGDVTCRAQGPDDGVHSVYQSARYSVRRGSYDAEPSQLALAYTYSKDVTSPIGGFSDGRSNIKSSINGDPASSRVDVYAQVGFILTANSVAFRPAQLVYKVGGRTLGQSDAFVTNRTRDNLNPTPMVWFDGPVPDAVMAARAPVTIEVVERDGGRRKLATARLPQPFELKAWAIANPPPSPFEPGTKEMRRLRPPGCR